MSSVESRCLYRPRRPAAAMSRSTSSGVRCSRLLSVAFGSRLGGTVPFTATGADGAATRKCLICEMVFSFYCPVLGHSRDTIAASVWANAPTLGRERAEVEDRNSWVVFHAADPR